MIGRTVFAILFIVAGSLHFFVPQSYLRIVPPYLPAPRMLLGISGAAEILGGLGLLVPSTRQAAAWGLVVLLIAVLPANIYMVTDHIKFAAIPLWALCLRLPLQLPLIYWAWLYTKRLPY
jgi:uncharacterized membrane protein